MKQLIISIFLITCISMKAFSQEAQMNTSQKSEKPREKVDSTNASEMKEEIKTDEKKDVKKDEKKDDKKDEKKNAKKTEKKNVAAVSFAKDVNPFIQKQCMPCHSEEETNPSDLYFTDYATMMKGGKHGLPFIAGKADSSILIQKLRPEPPFGKQMPLPGKRQKFTEEEIKMIVDWINQGAKNN